MVIFAAGRRYYAREDVRENRAADAAGPVNKWAVVGRLAGLFVLVMFFWVVFDQKTTTWIYFASDYLDIRFTTRSRSRARRTGAFSREPHGGEPVSDHLPRATPELGVRAAGGPGIHATGDGQDDRRVRLTAGACAVHALAGTWPPTRTGR